MEETWNIRGEREVGEVGDMLRNLMESFTFDADDIGRAAVLLAITKNAAMEDECKLRIEELGWRAVATEVGGLLRDLPQKIIRALLGASLNSGIIEKNNREMHALIHAAIEAGNTLVKRGIVELSVGAKIAIVRNDEWIAVSIFGDCAAHSVAHHHCCGLGVMHI